MKVTKEDVLAAVETYVRTWAAHGVEMVVKYQEGVPSAGQAHRLFRDNGERAWGTGDRGYIGWSKAEAFETLNIISRTLADLSFARQMQEERRKV